MKICEKCGTVNYFKPDDDLKCSVCGFNFKTFKFTTIGDGNSLTRPKPSLDDLDTWAIKN